MSTDIKHYLALWLAPEIGPKTFAALNAAFPDVAEIFAKPGRLQSKFSLSPQTLAYLNTPDWQRVEQHLAWQATSTDHHILTLPDPDYPKALREIPDPPPVLFVAGDVTLLNDPLLAMVGSRRMSAYGKDNAFHFAKHLTESGLGIVSGLATGIDTQAHQGALAARYGRTIAVLCTGIEQVYPPQNRALAAKIRERGALVSELPLGTPATRQNFPRRNRIITGMSLGVLVIEAALPSGSLISARLALEQGREVFAIPGSIHSPLSKGCHHLLRTGAKLVESSADVLIELKPLLSDTLMRKNIVIESPAVKAQAESVRLEPEYQSLLAHIDYDPTPSDVIIARSQLKPQVVSSMLLMLELDGYIAGAPGGYVRLK